MKIDRRTFLGGMGAAGVSLMLPSGKAEAAVSGDAYATLIDLTRCDGCENKLTKDGMPQCVAACRSENKSKFPEPDKKMLKPYWPQKKFEDWSSSKKRKITSRLTPYNWLFVQNVKVSVEGEEVVINVPRRCMHCDNPPCVKLCPFGALNKSSDGPTHVNPDLCFGGAKCRTVCPWEVPQRQAGVGIYTNLDPLPVGGGVMYKCDLCRDRLTEGKKPACVEACPRGAMEIGTRDEIFKKAESLKKQYGGYIYGDEENGGTSTLYVSKVPFSAIDKAVVEKAKKAKVKFLRKPMRMKKAESMLEKYRGIGIAAIAAPFVGALAAFAGKVTRKEEQDNE